MSNLLFVVAPTDFRDEELFVPRRELEAAGHQVTVASTRAGTCIGVHDGTVEATLALAAAVPSDYDGVVFIGGSGARVLFDDPDAHRIAQALHRAGGLVAAICVAPTILARAGLLRGRRATAFSSALPALSVAGAVLATDDVVVDGNLVTASGPAFARGFGHAIVRALDTPRDTVPLKHAHKLLAFLPVLLMAAPAHATEITLVHINDTHSHLAPYGPKDLQLDGTLGGLTKAASVIDAIQNEDPSALFVHGGDLMHGDAFFNEYLGVAELQLLQSLGLDVMVLGNHEFDLGPDFLTAVLNATWPAGGNVPILSTNLDLSGYPVLANWVTTEPVVMEVSGVRVGLFGLTTPYVINAMPAPAVLRDDLAEIAATSTVRLRDQGAQVVICLCHLGLDLSTALAEEVPGIDVIVNAHDHVALAVPLSITNSAGGTTTIVSAGAYYRWVGRLTLAVEDDGVSVAAYELIDVDRSVPRLPAIDAVVHSLEAGIVARYGDLYHRVLAWAVTTIPVEADPDSAWRDHAVGNLWTDAYRERTGTEIAVDVDGYLDEPLPRGLVVGADVLRANSGGLPDVDPASATLRVPPFRLATFELTGAQLVQALETVIFLGGDVFPQVSGMRFDFDSRRLPGQRVLVETVRVQGRRLDPARIYTLTSTEAVLMFLPLLGIDAGNPRVLPDVAFEAARTLIRKRGILLPFSEGRIRDRALLPGRR